MLQVDNFEAKTYGALRLISSFRNLLQPLNRLPPEALSRIIRHVPNEQDTDARVIVVLTHVCRYWREFIISTPWNWTLISSRSDGLAALSLQRAKAAPLEMCIDMDEVKKTPGFCDLINPFIQSTKTLSFDKFIKVKELTRTLPDFPRSMPNLQSLTLDGARRTDQVEVNSGDLFESLTPTLRYLNLSHFPLYPSFFRLRALTELTLHTHYFNLHLDTLLDFLEENRSLKSAILGIDFTESSLLSSRRGAAIANQLQRLSIPTGETGKALISNIALRRGAHLVIDSNSYKGLYDLLSGVSTAHLLNLSSPTFMEYQSHGYDRSIRLLGPSGSFLFRKSYSSKNVFEEFPVLPLTNFREFRFIFQGLEWGTMFNPSFFPALEIFAAQGRIWGSGPLSTLLSNPSSPPSLKTLAFSNCNLSGNFMEGLTLFASNRKNTTSALLRRVVIVDSKENLPSVDSMDALGKHVPIVDVRIGKELPTDLT